MTKFFFKLKEKPAFGPFPQFLGGKKSYSKKSGTHNLIRFFSNMPNFRETWCSNSKNKRNRKQDGGTNILFRKILLATARGPVYQNISSLHLFILEIQSILCELVSACKKSGYFIDLFWRYGWLKKSCNLIGWEHFRPYLRDKTFPKYGICAGTQQIIQAFSIEQIQ